MHRFNDHNMRQTDVKEQLKQNAANVAVSRVYRNSLTLAALHFKLAQFDQALTEILETIKLAQTKGDKETVIECAIWL